MTSEPPSIETNEREERQRVWRLKGEGVPNHRVSRSVMSIDGGEPKTEYAVSLVDSRTGQPVHLFLNSGGLQFARMVIDAADDDWAAHPVEVEDSGTGVVMDASDQVDEFLPEEIPAPIDEPEPEPDLEDVLPDPIEGQRCRFSVDHPELVSHGKPCEKEADKICGAGWCHGHHSDRHRKNQCREEGA